jgi:hypothetical protein
VEEREDVDGWGGSGFHDFGPFVHECVEFEHVRSLDIGSSDAVDYGPKLARRMIQTDGRTMNK